MWKVIALALPGLFLLTACSSDASSTTSGGGGAASSASSTEAATSSASSSSAAASTGSGGAGGASSSSGAGGMAPFALTSMVLTEGAMFDPKYTCGGMNVSPDLEWTPGPAGTKSYTIVFTDMSNSLIHWAIFDIPANLPGLPEAVENAASPANVPGATQVLSFDNSTFGYRGPCPPSLHTYQFVLYAVDTASLPGVTSASTRAEVEAAVMQHDIASATLSGQADKQN